VEYAIQLLLPILGGLLLGNWLHKTFGISQIWTMALAVLGMFAGIAILYKRQMMGDNPVPKISFTLPGSKPEKAAKKSSAKPKLDETSKKGAISHEELLELYQKADREPPTDDVALDDLLEDDEGPEPKKR
jgi:hypothetical protein